MGLLASKGGDSMDAREQAKQQYVNSAILNKRAATGGDSRTANKHARIVKRITDKMRDGRIDKSILVELLTHEEISVRTLAAVDLLRMKHEVPKAAAVLAEIAGMDETGKRIDEKISIMAAGYQLRHWEETGSAIQ